jgi:flagellar hook protein FlgE
MSLFGALSSGVSGLNAFSGALGIISDNITNVNTVGYKGSNAEFSTLVTGARGSQNYTPGGVETKPRTLVSRQGLLQSSQDPTHLSIDGAGFFIVRTGTGPENEVRFTRSGSFTQDADGFLKNTAGLYLQGWQLDGNGDFSNNGSVSELVPINISGLTGTAEATSSIRMSANLQSNAPLRDVVINNLYDPANPDFNMANNPTLANFSQKLEVFDAQGGRREVTFSFLRSSTPNQWHVEIFGNPGEVVEGAGLVNSQLATGIIAFNPDGSFDMDNTTVPLGNRLPAQELNVTWAGNVGSLPISLNFGSNDSIDGITQFASQSVLRSSGVDGARFGNVVGVSVDKEGVVTALFDNGLNRAVYKLPLATFLNPDGLTRMQGNAYGISDFSGTFAMVEANSGGAGSFAPSTLEGSTVDLAAEFTKLITTQRAFSASTRVITTADEMLNELTNLKR